ncbi:MAG: polysaccharide biosynthesis protein CapD, partial [Sphingobacteriaceae bacterium]|nr:polysaccharide biosynthesis protein CapD [Sphingobacteriaceae bacterium]
MFNKISIVPRWIIFCIDLLCCGFSLGFAYFIKYNFEASNININEMSRNMLVFLLI